MFISLNGFGDNNWYAISGILNVNNFRLCSFNMFRVIDNLCIANK